MDFDHYMEALKLWHGIRTDLKTNLCKLTADEGIIKGHEKSYNKESFLGHSMEDQTKRAYLCIASGKLETFGRISELDRKY